jgi:DNA-binding protein YbaB
MADLGSLEGLSAEDITRLASVGKAVLTHPKTRTQAQRLVKEVDPTASFPELDIDDRIRKEREEWQAELDKRDKAQAEKEAAQRRQDSLSSLVTSGTLEAKDVQIDPEKKVSPIEQYMLDNKISDYASAARLYRKEQAPADVTHSPFISQAPSHPSLPTIDLAGRNLNQWATDVAYQTAADLKSGKLKVDELGYEVRR